MKRKCLPRFRASRPTPLELQAVAQYAWPAYFAVGDAFLAATCSLGACPETQRARQLSGERLGLAARALEPRVVACTLRGFPGVSEINLNHKQLGRAALIVGERLSCPEVCP